LRKHNASKTFGLSSNSKQTQQAHCETGNVQHSVILLLYTCSSQINWRATAQLCWWEEPLPSRFSLKTARVLIKSTWATVFGCKCSETGGLPRGVLLYAPMTINWGFIGLMVDTRGALPSRHPRKMRLFWSSRLERRLEHCVGGSEPQWSLTWFAHTVEYELMVPLVPYAPGQAWYFEPSRTNEKSQHGSQYYASRSPGVGVLKTCGSVQGSHAPWIRHWWFPQCHSVEFKTGAGFRAKETAEIESWLEGGQ